MNVAAEVVKDVVDGEQVVVVEDAHGRHLVVVEWRCSSCRSQPCSHVLAALKTLNKEAPCPSSNRAG